MSKAFKPVEEPYFAYLSLASYEVQLSTGLHCRLSGYDALGSRMFWHSVFMSHVGWFTSTYCSCT